MTDFVLRTGTERSLYVESLLSCIDSGTVTLVQACQDIENMCRATGAVSDEMARAVSTRIRGILAAYMAHTIDATLAAKNVVDVINAVAPQATY